MGNSQENSKPTVVIAPVNQQPTIKEIQGDFLRHPKLADLFKEPAANTPGLVLTIKNKDIQELPNLRRLIDLALEDANEASLMDAPIVMPDVIEITNKRNGQAAAFRRDDIGTEHETTTLSIHSGAILRLNSDTLRANISHEFGHENQPYIENKSVAQKQLDELAADRYARYPLNMAIGLLVDDSLNEHYSTQVKSADHPNTHDRIAALLEKAYGDGMFRFSGEYGSDHYFHPARLDNIPVTEQGYKITNWDNELVPEIKKRVAEDMQYLDIQVKDGVTLNKLDKFIKREESRIAEFRAEHVFQAEPPSREYIASHFVESLKNPNKVEQVKAMHDGMANVYEALDISRQYAVLHLPTEEHRSNFVRCVVDNLAQGLRNGQFPDTEYLKTNKFETDINNACPVK